MLNNKILKCSLIIFLVFILCFSFQVSAQDINNDYLARDSISVTVSIGEYVDLSFEDTGEMVDDRPQLFLDLAQEVSTELDMITRGNIDYTLAFDSEHGFDGDLEEAENVDQYFEYFVLEVDEDLPEEDWQVETFEPGGELTADQIGDEPGHRDWYFGLRLEEEMAEVWETLLEAGMDFEVLPDDEWTQLAAGEYDDLVIITITQQQ